VNTFKESSDNLRPDSIDKLKYVISTSDLPSQALDSALKALDHLSDTPEGSTEYNNILTYIDYLIKLPWNRKTNNSTDLSRTETVLNEAVKGSSHVRDKILSHLASRVLNTNPHVKILVVDDEKIALKNLSHLLRKEDYDVVTCENGEEAIRHLSETEFDIVMTDLRMANVDGIQVLEKTKTLCPKARVILITGYATTETAVEAMRKGAFHYIVKPVQIEELRLIIKEALGQKKPAQSTSPVLCLSGPDDIDKRALARAIADSLGRKFIEFPLEKLTDESDINGQSRINGGVSPGLIMKNIYLSGSSNPVVLLDGIDNLNKDLAALMNDVLQPEKSRDFIDRYLEVPFDLAKVIFIATADHIDNIPYPLNDSLEIVEM